LFTIKEAYTYINSVYISTVYTNLVHKHNTYKSKGQKLAT